MSTETSKEKKMSREYIAIIVLALSLFVVAMTDIFKPLPQEHDDTSFMSAVRNEEAKAQIIMRKNETILLLLEGVYLQDSTNFNPYQKSVIKSLITDHKYRAVDVLKGSN